MTLIISGNLALTLNSKWKSKILCLVGQKEKKLVWKKVLVENNRYSFREEEEEEGSGYQCKYSLSKKDKPLSSSRPSSRYLLLLSEIVLRKPCCRTSPANDDATDKS